MGDPYFIAQIGLVRACVARPRRNCLAIWRLDVVALTFSPSNADSRDMFSRLFAYAPVFLRKSEDRICLPSGDQTGSHATLSARDFQDVTFPPTFLFFATFFSAEPITAQFLQFSGHDDYAYKLALGFPQLWGRRLLFRPIGRIFQPRWFRIAHISCNIRKRGPPHALSGYHHG